MYDEHLIRSRLFEYQNMLLSLCSFTPEFTTPVAEWCHSMMMRKVDAFLIKGMNDELSPLLWQSQENGFKGESKERKALLFFLLRKQIELYIVFRQLYKIKSSISTTAYNQLLLVLEFSAIILSNVRLADWPRVSYSQASSLCNLMAYWKRWRGKTLHVPMSSTTHLIASFDFVDH